MSVQRRSHWMRYTLISAGAYNLAFGAWTILFPDSFFSLLHLPLPNYPQIWQCLGMVVGVYGLGYFIAATNPLRHWPIVFVGLAGKILGPLGFIHAYLTGSLPLSFGLLNIPNDLIWWLPFTLILYHAGKNSRATP